MLVPASADVGAGELHAEADVTSRNAHALLHVLAWICCGCAIYSLWLNEQWWALGLAIVGWVGLKLDDDVDD